MEPSPALKWSARLLFLAPRIKLYLLFQENAVLLAYPNQEYVQCLVTPTTGRLMVDHLIFKGTASTCLPKIAPKETLALLCKTMESDQDSMPGVEISLHQRLTVKLNGRKMALPYTSPHVTVISEKGFVDVRTARGISLKWDGDSYLEVGASPQYKGQLCGICGNYNGYERDDFIGGDGLFKWDKSSFAESWRFGENIFDCTRPSYDLTGMEPCDRNLFTKFRAREKCSVFKSKEFRHCYQVVDPTEYYKSCMTDTCECPKSKKCSCESIRAYSAACDRMGVTLNWDRNLHCKTTCQRGKVYSSCGPPCKINCRNYKNRRRNKRCRKRPCVAGCHCPAGYVLFKKRCMKKSSCSNKQLTGTKKKISALKTRKKLYFKKLVDDT